MKPGRNKPCPCGSGTKYKRCCLDKRSPGASARRIGPVDLPPSVLANLRRHQLRLRERLQRFGHILPQISMDVAGYKFMAVGPELHYGKWKTFHDFLFHYIAY